MEELIRRADFWLAIIGSLSAVWSIALSVYLTRDIDRKSLLPRLTGVLSGMAILLTDVANRAQQRADRA